jgi:hypothetical protein
MNPLGSHGLKRKNGLSGSRGYRCQFILEVWLKRGIEIIQMWNVYYNRLQ